MSYFVDDSKPIFLQISEKIEDDILDQSIGEDEVIPSTNQFSKHFQINPATAAKGINKLVDDGIVYKKRGIGMFVSPGAREVIMNKRRNNFYREYVIPLLKEATKINMSKEDVLHLINSKDTEEEND